MQGLALLFRGPRLGQGLGIQRCTFWPRVLAKFSALSLMAISFLCFSKSWDSMNVRARNCTLTNEQSWEPRLLAAAGLHGPCLIQRCVGTQLQGPKELLF